MDIQKVEVNSSFEPDSELKEALSEFEGRFQIKHFLLSEKKKKKKAGLYLLKLFYDGFFNVLLDF